MNKIPTLDVLETSFQADLGWRRKELSSLYLAVISSPPSSEAQHRAIRSGILLSYAHLEGFCRQATRCYYEYVRGRNLLYGDLASSFLAVKLSRLANQGTTKASYYQDAVSLLTSGINDPAELPEPEIITAKSNLSFAQFREILFCINVSHEPFSTKENFFDAVVLDRRNAIAHGEFRRPSLTDYLEIHTGIVELLDQLQVHLITSATNETFLKPTLLRV